MNLAATKLALYNWLSKVMGYPNIFTITFDVDFVTGNQINGTIGASVLDPVVFTDDHATTLALLAEEIQKTAEIFKATVTGPRQITCVGAVNGTTVTPITITVTLGAVQPVDTVAQVQDAQGVRVIHAHQNAPRKGENDDLYPYAVIRLDSFQQIGWDELREIDDNNIATFGGLRRGTVSISVFGEGALEYATQASNSLEMQTYIDLLSAAGIAILEKSSVQNLTAMLETKYEPRADFDFFIGYADNVEDDLGIIEKAELSGTVKGGKNGDLVIPSKIIGE